MKYIRKAEKGRGNITGDQDIRREGNIEEKSKVERERERERENERERETIDIPRVRITIDPTTVKLDVAIYRP